MHHAHRERARGPGETRDVAVEGHEDAARIKAWLLRHPFEIRSTCAIVVVAAADPVRHLIADLFPLRIGPASPVRSAEDLVKNLAASVVNRYTVGTQVAVGDPTDILAERARSADLLVIGSHGRKGLERFLLGSISHALLHRVPMSGLDRTVQPTIDHCHT